MGLSELQWRVQKAQRSEKTPEQWKNLPMEDGEIAMAIRDYARGMSFTHGLRTPAEKLLVQIADRQWDLLEAQTTQSEYLRKINNVVQLIGVLIILSLIGSCLLALLGGGSLF